MKIFAFSGLGADHRIFNELSIHGDLEVVPWLPISKEDTLKSYALKMMEQMPESEDFALLGVSFGGMLVSEIARERKANKVILVSSASSKKELPGLYDLPFPVQKMPNWFYRMPKFISRFLFNPKNESLLFDILDDTDPSFVKNAVGLINEWDREGSLENVFRIHGTRDRIIPLNVQPNIEVEGGHFIVVDQADQISQSINAYLEA